MTCLPPEENTGNILYLQFQQKYKYSKTIYGYTVYVPFVY